MTLDITTTTYFTYHNFRWLFIRQDLYEVSVFGRQREDFSLISFDLFFADFVFELSLKCYKKYQFLQNNEFDLKLHNLHKLHKKTFLLQDLIFCHPLKLSSFHLEGELSVIICFNFQSCLFKMNCCRRVMLNLDCHLNFFRSL